MEKDANRIKYLDGLRGLAALVVFVGHYNMLFNCNIFFNGLSLLNLSKLPKVIYFPLNALVLFFTNGNLSVSIFFILSGFALSYPYFSTKNHEVIVTSTLKRYFRLTVPILFTVLLISFLYSFNLFYSKADVLSLRVTQDTYLFYNGRIETNFLMALCNGLYSCLALGSKYYNPVLWTMGVEFYGSLLVFAVIGIFGISTIRFYVYIILILFFIDNYYYLFIAGVAASDLYNTKAQTTYFNKPWLGLGLLFIGFIVSVFYFNKFMLTHLPIGELNTNKVHAINRVAALFIVAGVLFSTIAQKALMKNSCLQLGKISFMLYLLHVPFMSIVSVFFIKLFEKILPYNVTIELAFFTTTLLLFLSCKYIFIFFDKWGVDFSKWVVTSILSKKPYFLPKDKEVQ